MEILIWGAGANGKELKKICDKQGWKVRAFIDNDESKVRALGGGVFLLPMFQLRIQRMCRYG